MDRTIAIVILGLGVTVASVSAALAAGQRSFVASNGSNVGGCTPAAPCRNFDYAISQTNVGGEVVVLDSAGYGPVNITKAITIVAPPGVYAGISVFTGVGIAVNAAGTDTVILRGLTINGQGGDSGIRVLAAGTVQIEGCVISGLNKGIYVEPSQPIHVVVLNTILRNNNGVGLGAVSQSVAGSQSDLVASKVEVRNNASGIVINAIRRVEIAESVIVNNYGYGMSFVASGGLLSENPSVAIDRSVVAQNDYGVDAAGSSPFTTVVNVANSMISGNSLVGVESGALSYIRVAGTQINGNGTGIQRFSGGQIVTLGTNMLYGNGFDGSFSATLAPN